MRAAPLPRRAGQGRADRVDEAGMRVGGDELHAAQAAGDETAKERQPGSTVL